MVGASIYTALADDETVAALVATRIYAQVIPQGGASPCIVFNIVSATPINAFDGHSGTENARVQLDMLHTTWSGVRALAAAARGALQGYTDADADPAISSCMLISEQDDNEQPKTDSENIVRRVIQEYTVWYAGE